MSLKKQIHLGVGHVSCSQKNVSRIGFQQGSTHFSMSILLLVLLQVCLPAILFCDEFSQETTFRTLRVSCRNNWFPILGRNL